MTGPWYETMNAGYEALKLGKYERAAELFYDAQHVASGPMQVELAGKALRRAREAISDSYEAIAAESDAGYWRNPPSSKK